VGVGELINPMLLLPLKQETRVPRGIDF